MKFDLKLNLYNIIKEEFDKKPTPEIEEPRCEDLTDRFGNYGEAKQHAKDRDLPCFKLYGVTYSTEEVLHPEDEFLDEEEVLEETERPGGGHEKSQYEKKTDDDSIEMDGFAKATYDATGESGYVIGDHMLKEWRDDGCPPGSVSHEGQCLDGSTDLGRIILHMKRMQYDPEYRRQMKHLDAQRIEDIRSGRLKWDDNRGFVWAGPSIGPKYVMCRRRSKCIGALH